MRQAPLRDTHTHTHPFNGPFSGTTRVSWYQKGKTNLDFTEARDSEWQWHQLGHMQVCTLLQTDNHASNPPLKRHRTENSNKKLMTSQLENASAQAHKYTYTSTHTQTHQQLKKIMPLVPSMDGHTRLHTRLIRPFF